MNQRTGRFPLLKSCTLYIAQEGLYSLTMRNIAHYSNCSLGTLTYHFSSRETLIEAVFEDYIIPSLQKHFLLHKHPNPVVSFLEYYKSSLPFSAEQITLWRARFELTGFSIHKPKLRSLMQKHQYKTQNYIEKYMEWLHSLNQLKIGIDCHKKAGEIVLMEQGTALAIIEAKPDERTKTADLFLNWLKECFIL